MDERGVGGSAGNGARFYPEMYFDCVIRFWSGFCFNHSLVFVTGDFSNVYTIMYRIKTDL